LAGDPAWSAAMKNEPFFTAEGGDKYLPTSAGRSPWDPKFMHGRIVIGLLGQEIERRHGGPAYPPAPRTVDMYRLPDFSPVEVRTRIVRDGKRIKVIDAEFFSGGVSMARATSQLLLRTENPPGEVWSRPDWKAPRPADIPAPTDARAGMN